MKPEPIPKHVYAHNFMTMDFIVIPPSVVELSNLFQQTKNMYEQFIPRVNGFEGMTKIVNSKVPEVFGKYFEWIDSLKIEQMSDQDIIDSDYYFHLYGLACEFNKLFCFLLKVTNFNIEDKYLELFKRNKKLLKRLAILDFGQRFSEAKINEYHDNIYYLLLSDSVHIQGVYAYRKDFISGLKCSEKNHEYFDHITEEKKEYNNYTESVHLFFLCELYNNVQNHEKSFSLFKQACDLLFKFLTTDEAKREGLSIKTNVQIINSINLLLEAIKDVAQNKKRNLLDVFITEIPKFRSYIQENKNFLSYFKKKTEDTIEFFYQEYFAFLTKEFSSSTISFHLNRKSMCLKASNINLKKILHDCEITWSFDKKQGYIVSNIHLQNIAKIESISKAIEEQEKKSEQKVQQFQPDKKIEDTQIPSEQKADNNNNNNQEQETEGFSEKPLESKEQRNLPTTLKASDLGFDKKYDSYKVYHIEKQGVKGVFYGFFKPAKKLIHQDRITEAVLINHENILSKEKTVGPKWEKGIKFVPLPKNLVKQYQQQLAQQQNDNNNVIATNTNLTLKLGYTFKTKPLTKDIEFLAKVVEIKEEPKTGKQKVLFRFWQTIDHKSNDDENVLKLITKAYN